MVLKHQLVIPTLGEMFRYDDAFSIGTLVEWIPSNFGDLALEYSVMGNTERPLFESADKVLKIAGQRNAIESAISKYLADGQFSFRGHMLLFELDHLCFDDAADSDRYIATCKSEFAHDSPALPPTPCAGNGFWDLKFRLKRFNVIEFIRDDELYL